MSSYLRPTNLEDALHHLASVPATVIAGGTDFYPARVGRPVDEAILDISAIEELRGISTTSRHWRIGATTTWRDLLDAELPGCFDGLRAAARQVGGQQVQNVATVAGNLCNASPAADGVPPLLSLDAVVEIHGANGVRLLPLADFVLGNRRTALEGSDLLTAVLVPKAWEGARGGFLKLGARSSLVISIVMVAGTLTVDTHGSVERAALAIGLAATRSHREGRPVRVADAER